MQKWFVRFPHIGIVWKKSWNFLIGLCIDHSSTITSKNKSVLNEQLRIYDLSGKNKMLENRSDYILCISNFSQLMQFEKIEKRIKQFFFFQWNSGK